MIEKIITYVPSIIGLILVGFVVYNSKNTSRTNKTFLALITAVCLWLLALFVADMSTDKDLALFAIRIAIIPCVLSSYFFLLFCLNFPVERRTSLKSMIVYSLPAFAISSVALTPFIVTDVRLEATGARLAAVTPLYTLETIIIVCYFIAGGYILLKKRLRSSGKQKRQINLLLAGIGLALIVNIFTGYIFAFLNIGGMGVLLGNLSIFVFVGITAYAIVKHGLFDIRQAIVRSVAYVLALATLALMYYLVAYLVSITFFKGEVNSTLSISPINTILALLLAFVFQPIKTFFDKITNDIFYRDRYHANEFIARLNEELATTTDLRNLLERAAVEIATTLKSEHALFYVQYSDSRYVTAGTKEHRAISHKDIEPIHNHISGDNTEIIVSELLPDHSEIRKVLLKSKIALLLPLMHRKSEIGYLALGEQQGSGYAKRDLDVLRAVSDGLVIAIQNALSVQEVKNINAHLQQRIDEATEELRYSNRKLKQLDASKDEFISMASHQLRTPLTSVKGYVSMVLEGDVGRITKGQRQVLEQAYDSSQRMVYLISDFLNVSRLQTGKFVLERSEVQLPSLITEELAQLQASAQARNVTLNYTPPSSFPSLYLDENKIRQVMMNFIDNAIYYARPAGGDITVTLAKHASHITFRVIDNGLGVPKHEQKQLFTKFYRASNARQARPDGTGIGLFMAKKVIVAHGGAIIFESKEGQGSTFGFRLPLEDSAN